MIVFRRFSRIPAKKASFWGLILRISGRANGGLHSIMQGNMRCSEAQRVDLVEGLDKGDTIQTRTIKGILLGFHGFLTATAPRAYNG